MPTLYVADSAGSYVRAKDSQVIEAARVAVGRALRRGIRFDSPSAARKYLPAMLGTLEHEVFCVAHMDGNHRLIAFEEMFRGTVDAASVYPREVVKSALLHNSATVAFIHNHPSGSAQPSLPDEAMTQKLKTALAVVEIRVVDHFIVAGDCVTSFSELGLL